MLELSAPFLFSQSREILCNIYNNNVCGYTVQEA